jgi:hypothetical protein
MLEGAVQVRIEVEWLEGEKFRLGRSPNDHPEAPNSISVIGGLPGRRARHALLRFAHCPPGLPVELWRSGPEALARRAWLSQRFVGTLSEDGNVLHGQWERSTDDLAWTDDLKIAYRWVGG